MNERRGLVDVFAAGARPLALAVLGLLLLELTGFDISISDALHDFPSHRWPLRDLWIVEIALHERLRDLVVAVGALCLVAVVCFHFARRLPIRDDAAQVVLSILVCTGAVAGMKVVINRHCPWDWARYGGHIPDDRAASGPLLCVEGHGRCFPSGHAAGGFSFLSLYFVGRRRRPSAARAGLAAGMAAGWTMGFIQVARGAHFFSHVIWSAAVCWYACCVLDVARTRLRSGRETSPAPRR